MIKSYQEEQQLAEAEREPEGQKTATIGQVLADGVTLIWDDDGKESKKRYKTNRSVVFHPGDRVKICEIASTYVVEYAYGNPVTQLRADVAAIAETAQYATSAGSAKNAENAATAASANTAKSAEKADFATTAETAKTADKAKATDTCTTAMYLQSNDDMMDGVRLTYNYYKKEYAIVSKRYDNTWRKINTG